MKRLILIAALLSGCETTTGIQMSDQEAEACKAQGCTVWTEGELQQLVMKVFRDAFQRGAQSTGRAL